VALIDRIFRDGDDTDAISNHAFSAAVYFWAKGDLTRAQVITAFGLTATDEVQLDQLQAYYVGLSAEDKQEFHSRLEGAGILAEQGFITQAFYKGLLGLT
jgi:hypothetical protein